MNEEQKTPEVIEDAPEELVVENPETGEDEVVTPDQLPPEYVEAGNTVYSGTSETGTDEGRGFNAE